MVLELLSLEFPKALTASQYLLYLSILITPLGFVLDVAAPRTARSLPQGRLEPVGLRDQDDRGPERETELADKPQLDAQQTDGQPGT